MCVRNISLTWANYALTVSVCLAIYYPIVLLFNRKYFSRGLTKKTSESKPPSAYIADNEVTSVKPKYLNLFDEEVEEELNLAADDNDFKPEAQDFADEIQAYTASCSDEVDKEELVQSLRKIIQKYPSLISSEARYELSQLIAISAENNCSIHLSADELSELWTG